MDVEQHSRSDGCFKETKLSCDDIEDVEVNEVKDEIEIHDESLDYLSAAVQSDFSDGFDLLGLQSIEFVAVKEELDIEFKTEALSDEFDEEEHSGLQDGEVERPTPNCDLPKVERSLPCRDDVTPCRVLLDKGEVLRYFARTATNPLRRPGKAAPGLDSLQRRKQSKRQALQSCTPTISVKNHAGQPISQVRKNLLPATTSVSEHVTKQTPLKRTKIVSLREGIGKKNESPIVSTKFTCKCCKEKFPTKTFLYSHVCNSSFEQKTGTCGHCGKILDVKLIKSHVLACRGFSHFVCELCKISFKSKLVLKSHNCSKKYVDGGNNPSLQTTVIPSCNENSKFENEKVKQKSGMLVHEKLHFCGVCRIYFEIFDEFLSHRCSSSCIFDFKAAENILEASVSNNCTENSKNNSYEEYNLSENNSDLCNTNMDPLKNNKTYFWCANCNSNIKNNYEEKINHLSFCRCFITEKQITQRKSENDEYSTITNLMQSKPEIITKFKVQLSTLQSPKFTNGKQKPEIVKHSSPNRIVPVTSNSPSDNLRNDINKLAVYKNSVSPSTIVPSSLHLPCFKLTNKNQKTKVVEGSLPPSRKLPSPKLSCKRNVVKHSSFPIKIVSNLPSSTLTNKADQFLALKMKPPSTIIQNQHQCTQDCFIFSPMESYSNSHNFVCMVCHAEFKTNSELRSHNKLCHVISKTCSLRQYLCDKCPLLFKTKVELETHQAVHEEDALELDLNNSESCNVDDNSQIECNSKQNSPINSYNSPMDISATSATINELKTEGLSEINKEINLNINNVNFKIKESKKILMKLKNKTALKDNTEMAANVTKICQLPQNTNQSIKHNTVTNNKAISPSSSLKPEYLKDSFKTLNCKDCSLIFLTKVDIENHFKEQHKLLINYQCSVCTEVFSTRELADKHTQDMHYDGKDVNANKQPSISLKCVFCSKISENEMLLANHFLKVHRMILKLTNCEILKYKCNVCLEYFTTLTEKKSHVKSYHSKILFLGENKNNFKVLSTVEKKTTEDLTKSWQIYQCLRCRANFTSPFYLGEHYNVSHRNIKTNKSKTLPCLYCNCHFDSVIHLNFHIKLSHVACKICNNFYETQDQLSNHINLHNKCKIIFFLCNLCKKEFIFMPYFRKHGCYILKKFLKPQIVIRKFFVGNRNGKFVCVYCDSVYVSKEALSVHVAAVHQVSQCLYCGVSFCPLNAFSRRLSLPVLHCSVCEAEFADDC